MQCWCLFGNNLLSHNASPTASLLTNTASASCDDWEKLITSLAASARLLHIVACEAKSADGVSDERWLSSLLEHIDVEGLSQLSCWLLSVLVVEGPHSCRTLTVAREQSAALDHARDDYENLGKIRWS